eukprot:1075849_1
MSDKALFLCRFFRNPITQPTNMVMYSNATMYETQSDLFDMIVLIIIFNLTKHQVGPTMQAKHKKRLIITLQLKNAEVYPGSNLHGTVILQLMHKHSHHRHRTASIESVDLTPIKHDHESSYPSFTLGSLTVIDRVSISVTGVCNMNESITDREHFPSHLKLETDHFNILCGKQNILGNALQLGDTHNESIQFDFVVQLPPVLPCSYCGYFIQYLYYAQLFVSISKHVDATKCRVPFYVLPAAASPKHDIPHLLTPKNLQERMSIFRMRKKSHHRHSSSTSSASSTSPSHYSRVRCDSITQASPSLLLPPSDKSHFVENDLLSTTNKMMEEKNNISSYLNANALSLNYRDSNEYSDEFDTVASHIHSTKNNDNKFRISLSDEVIGTLLLNDTIFGDGQCIEGYLSLSTPCIVRVTLIHCEECAKQSHYTNCASYYQCCWFNPSFTFNLKIPNNAFKSFKSDLCQSSWSLNFQFAIAKHLLQNKQLISSSSGDNSSQVDGDADIWKLYELNNIKNNKKQPNRCQIDKILNWNLPIIVTTMHNPLRCVTRSNAVIVKC